MQRPPKLDVLQKIVRLNKGSRPYFSMCVGVCGHVCGCGVCVCASGVCEDGGGCECGRGCFLALTIASHWKRPAYPGGRTRLPIFKFSAKFPVHVILEQQINKTQNLLESDVQNYSNRKSVGSQPCTPL